MKRLNTVYGVFRVNTESTGCLWHLTHWAEPGAEAKFVKATGQGHNPQNMGIFVEQLTDFLTTLSFDSDECNTLIWSWGILIKNLSPRLFLIGYKYVWEWQFLNFVEKWNGIRHQNQCQNKVNFEWKNKKNDKCHIKMNNL